MKPLAMPSPITHSRYGSGPTVSTTITRGSSLASIASIISKYGSVCGPPAGVQVSILIVIASPTSGGRSGVMHWMRPSMAYVCGSE